VIDLVDHQVAAALLQRRRKSGQFGPLEQRPGGVGRRCHQRANAVAIPIALDQFRGQLIAHLGADRHELRGAFHQSQEVPVARITRIGQQPVLARIH